jgi:hypothetical protein
VEQLESRALHPILMNLCLDDTARCKMNDDAEACEARHAPVQHGATAAASTALPPMETFFFSHFEEIRQGEGAASIDAALTALDDKVGAMHTVH